MKRKLFLAMLQLLAAAVLLGTACMGAQVEEDIPEESAPAATETPEPIPEPTEKPDVAKKISVEQLLEANSIARILETHGSVSCEEGWSTGVGDGYSGARDYFKTENGVVAVTRLKYVPEGTEQIIVARYGEEPFSARLETDAEGIRSAFITASSEIDEELAASLISGAEAVTAGFTTLQIIAGTESNGSYRLTVIGKDPGNGEEMYEGAYVVDAESLIVSRGTCAEYMGQETSGTRTVSAVLDDPGAVCPEEPLLKGDEEETHTVSVTVRHPDGTEEKQTYLVGAGVRLFYEDYQNYTIYGDAAMRRKLKVDSRYDTELATCIGTVTKDIAIFVKQTGTD